MKFIRIIFFVFPLINWAQNRAIDVRQYEVSVTLSDSTDVIFVEETVWLEVLDSTREVWLDLYQHDSDGYGMSMDAEAVLLNNEKISSRQENNRIYFDSGKVPVTLHQPVTLKFRYSGIPKTGLIISENKFGERTFFGDNWPDRAHHWMACNDHPADKAVVRFTVTAPERYACVATGMLNSFEHRGNNITHSFHSNIPLPTKVMVIGLADFYTRFVEGQGFPVANYVYRKDSSAITDLNPTNDILDFYIAYIGKYPFEKLYNVQSTTQFGGMENAGNIFYDENAFKGKGTMEALIAHEIAHQWFGNSASESDWQHLWLSEGFATYFTDLYWLHSHGADAFRQRLAKERNQVISFYINYSHPVIDTAYASLMDLLNPNSYQKGAWVLHMFREKVGDEMFQNIIRSYYNKYQFSNASTKDFVSVASDVSSEDQQPFFDQWLRNSGHPVISAELRSKKKVHELNIKQVQKGQVFTFPIEIELTYKDNSADTIVLKVDTPDQTFRFCTDKRVKDFRLDPNVKLLFSQSKNH